MNIPYNQLSQTKVSVLEALCSTPNTYANKDLGKHGLQYVLYQFKDIKQMKPLSKILTYEQSKVGFEPTISSYDISHCSFKQKSKLKVKNLQLIAILYEIRSLPFS